ncbi:type II secretion system secretin GspD [Variovorax sp. PAMC26660]|uniref:type II secretion system secretin GspD n=1 Tax=Variovorax sp. PAMC26660 TaxID=2762322 RepID=UPI00164DFED2|nr:type II secretion system secretin GspD [Variovorax sp. PAMC26660]QNK66997.1 type II secretion system secretin GspD [Variovorax sp. PAMC26660]
MRRWTVACCIGMAALPLSAAGATTSAPAPAARVADRAPAPQPARSGKDEKVVLNFIDADITSVVSALARFLGRNFLFDPRVKGQITLVSEGEVPAATAYGMLASALRMRGFAIVDVGEVSRVVPVADAKMQGGSVNTRNPGGGLATRTFRLNYENAEAMVPVLKPLIAAENTITAYQANNTLVVTDYIDNLERLARIIESIDTPTSLDSEVIKLKNGVAVDIAGLATELLEGSGDKGKRDIVVLADPRSNSIVIRSSSPGRTSLARELVAKLESVQSDPGNLHVVYLRNAQAVHLSGVLRGLLTGESPDPATSGSGSVRAALGAGGMLGGAGGANGAGNGAANSSAASRSTGGASGTTGSSGSSSSTGGGLRGVSGAGGSGSQTGAAGGGSGSAAFSAGGVTVQADASTNTLIIAAPEPMYRSLRRVIDTLDQRRAQVLVESLIVEVTETDASELGIQWMAGGGNGRGVRAGTNFGGATLNPNARNTIEAMPRGLNIGIVDGTVNLPGVGEILNLKLLARALQTKGGANILSTPNILTLDNEAASIMVGKTVPFVSGQYITNGNSSTNPFQTIQREDIGLKLNIRPQISEGGTVKLDIYQEVSSIDDQASSAASGIVTNKRALDTSILVDDGQIMVLGGLMEDNVTNGTDAVPGLGSLPVLGNLFRYDKRQRVKTNLMIFLRPYVIRDADASRNLTLDRYNFMRARQGRSRPMPHGLLPDLGGPALPPSDVPTAGRTPEVDLRPQNWERTREQAPPPTASASQTRQMPAELAPPPPVTRSQLPRGVTVDSDPAALYGGANDKLAVVQIADAKDEQDAVRIVKRVRISGIGAYIVGGPGGEGNMVRADVPRDPQSVDNAITVLRELGYRPEMVVAP